MKTKKLKFTAEEEKENERFILKTKFDMETKLDKTTEPQHDAKQPFCWAVTGTFHGSIIEAETEGEARRIFHKHYNGESITHIKKRNVPAWAF